MCPPRQGPQVGVLKTAPAVTNTSARPSRIAREEADNLYTAISETKIMSPPSDCVIPIGEDLIKKGLAQVIDADFYEACTRPPSVYRGNPFIIEAALAGR